VQSANSRGVDGASADYCDNASTIVRTGSVQGCFVGARIAEDEAGAGRALRVIHRQWLGVYTAAGDDFGSSHIVVTLRQRLGEVRNEMHAGRIGTTGEDRFGVSGECREQRVLS
jgi:hypothetical protein